MRKLLGPVDLKDVVAAASGNAHEEIRSCANFGIWQLDRAGIGSIVACHHYFIREDTIANLYRSLYETFGPLASLKRYSEYLALLRGNLQIGPCCIGRLGQLATVVIDCSLPMLSLASRRSLLLRFLPHCDDEQRLKRAITIAAGVEFTAKDDRRVVLGAASIAERKSRREPAAVAQVDAPHQNKCGWRTRSAGTWSSRVPFDDCCATQQRPCG